jgi:anti-anti-sigma regulatory factor
MQPSAGEAEFSVDVSVVDARTVLLALRGSTERAAATLHRSVLSAVRSGRIRLIVDLDDLEHATPGMLGVLIEARRRLLRIGGGLVVVSRRSTSPLFDIGGTDQALARFADQDAALEALGTTR